MPRARTAEVDLKDLFTAMRSDRFALEPFRQSRYTTVQKYAGDRWSTETAVRKRPLNFLSLYLTLVPRNLISHNPQFGLKTFERAHRATANVLERWGNSEIERINLADTLHRVVLDGLIGPGGIVKVGLTTPSEAEMSGWELRYGQPNISVVDLDDWVMDMHARDVRECAYMGHRVRVPLASIKDSKLYPAAKRKKVKSQPDPRYNEPGDERITNIQRQWVTGEMIEAYEYVTLWEIYLPRERMVMTFLSEEGGYPVMSDYHGEDAPFEQREWVGPYCGPYHFLNYLFVPGQALGKGPVHDVLDMDEHLNALMWKLIQQAARQKSNTIVGGAADSDAVRLKDAADGEVLRIDNPDKVKVLESGGPNPVNNQFMMGMWDLVNKVAGNLELMGGLGAQSKTATQDKMLNANSSKSVEDMQQTTVAFTAKVIDSWLWFAHHHPTKVMEAYHPVEGLDVPIPIRATPADRQRVPYEKMKLQVHPYSFRYKTPQDEMAFLDSTMMQFLMPMMPLLKEQGIYVDVVKWLQLRAKYGNSPDLEEMLHLGEPAPTEGDGRNEKPGMPQQTERTYNRVNSSEATEQGQSKSIQQALLGQNAGGRNGVMQPMGAK